MFAIIIGFFESLLEKEGVSAVKTAVVGAATGGVSLVVKLIPWILGLILIAGIGFTGYHYYSKYEGMETAIVKLTADNTQLQDSVNAESKLLDKCSANTKALKDASDAQAKEDQEALAQAQAAASKSYTRSKKVLAAQAKPGQSDADAANALLNSYIPSTPSVVPAPAVNSAPIVPASTPETTK
jgi:hypothetical protein